MLPGTDAVHIEFKPTEPVAHELELELALLLGALAKAARGGVSGVRELGVAHHDLLGVNAAGKLLSLRLGLQFVLPFVQRIKIGAAQKDFASRLEELGNLPPTRSRGEHARYRRNEVDVLGDVFTNVAVAASGGGFEHPVAVREVDGETVYLQFTQPPHLTPGCGDSLLHPLTQLNKAKNVV